MLQTQTTKHNNQARISGHAPPLLTHRKHRQLLVHAHKSRGLDVGKAVGVVHGPAGQLGLTQDQGQHLRGVDASVSVSGMLPCIAAPWQPSPAQLLQLACTLCLLWPNRRRQSPSTRPIRPPLNPSPLAPKSPERHSLVGGLMPAALPAPWGLGCPPAPDPHPHHHASGTSGTDCRRR